MLVTDRFVLLNYPRTGSTFAREALRALHQRRTPAWRRALERLSLARPALVELELPIERTVTARREDRRSQHGALSQIPPGHRGKPVVSIARHPLDRAVSAYEHGFWRTRPLGDPQAIRDRFPSFPELSFDEYLEYGLAFEAPDVLQGACPQADVGPHTLQFLRFYSADPQATLAGLTDARIDSGEVLRSLPPVRFLHTERLVEELIDLLHDVGFGPGQTAFLRELPRVNAAGSRRGRAWREYFSPEQERAFRQRERLLFQVFPEYA